MGPVRAGARHRGTLVDVVVPGDADDAVRWVGVDPAVALGDQDPDPVYDQDDRLWHLRFRPEQAGDAVLHLIRERPGRRPLKVRVTLRIGTRYPRRRQ